MITFVATFGAFAVALAALGAGLLLGGASLRGSCGGAGECHCSTAVARNCPRRNRGRERS